MSREQWGNGYYKGLADGLKAKINFYDFCVLAYGDEDSPLGDFVADMQRDTDFSWKESSRKTILKHLHYKCACFKAIRAFNQLWKEWKEVTRSK